MIAIVHTNDGHTKFAREEGCAGYAGVMGLVKQLRAQYGDDNVCLVDAGDSLSGGRMGRINDGELAVKAMNHAGYVASCPGNADFAHGTKRLLELAKTTDFPYLCCNLKYAESGELVFPAYLVREMGGVKVGFVGMNTPALIGTAAPISFAEADGSVPFTFSQDTTGQAFYDAVQDAVDAARAEGAQLVIGLAHLGQKGQNPLWTSDATAKNTHGIDVLVDAHSHEVLNQTIVGNQGQSMTLVQAGAYQSHVGVILHDEQTGAIECRIIEAGDTPVDVEMEEFLNTQIQPAMEALEEVVGHTDYPLLSRKEDGVSWLIRTAETSFGDLVGDAYKWVADADVAYLPGWTIRANIPVGPITAGDLYDILPVKMNVVRTKLSGRELADLLEFASRAYPASDAVFPQISGMTIQIDPSVPSAAVANEQGCFICVEGQRRVTNIMVAGEPLDFDKEYMVASVDLVLKYGGNGFSQFLGDARVQDTGVSNTDALRRYIGEELGGVVSQGYENPLGDGRIQILE